MSQSGILSKLKQKWVNEHHKDSTDQGIIKEGMPLGYTNLSFPFLVLALGLIFAVATWVTERILTACPKNTVQRAHDLHLTEPATMMNGN